MKVEVDALIASAKPVPVKYYGENDVVEDDKVNPPVIYKAQAQLYNELMKNGITVYVISAGSEEIVRMVVSDPQYGYNLPPENVIGVATLLRNATSKEITTSRLQIEQKSYNQQNNLDLVYTPILWSPLTWYSGKWAAILEYIDPWKKPVLVAGDTPISDGPMLFQGVDIKKGGIHLWVNRSQRNFGVLQTMIATNAAAQAKEGLDVTADKNWVVVTPSQLLNS